MGDWSQFIARWKMGISWLSKPLELGVLFWCHPCHTLQNLDQKWRLRIRIQGWQWSFRYPDQSWKPDLGWSMYIELYISKYGLNGYRYHFVFFFWEVNVGCWTTKQQIIPQVGGNSSTAGEFCGWAESRTQGGTTRVNPMRTRRKSTLSGNIAKTDVWMEKHV